MKTLYSIKPTKPIQTITKLFIQRRKLSISLTLGLLLAITGLTISQVNHPNKALAVTPPDSCFSFDSGSGTINDYYDNQNNDSGQPACTKEVDIPSTIGGVAVTTIGDHAFYFNQLTTVTIPSSVTSLGAMAFYLQTKPGGTSYVDFLMNFGNPQAFIDSVIVTQIYADDPNALGLYDLMLTEADMGAGDINANGNLDDVVSAQLINPGFLKATFKDASGTELISPQLYTGTGLTSYLAKDNPTSDLGLYYKAGDTPNQTITPPSITGYSTPADQTFNTTLATGENILAFVYQSEAGGSTPTPVPTNIKVDDVPIKDNLTISTRPTFSGTTTPNSEVTVTVHPDPVSCSTTSDSNGNWSCTLPADLAPGEHTVNILVTKPDNSTEEFGPYTVNVLADSTTTIDNNTPLANTGTFLLAGSLLAIAIVGITLLLHKAGRRQKGYYRV